jgi:hypothetical protein
MVWPQRAIGLKIVNQKKQQQHATNDICVPFPKELFQKNICTNIFGGSQSL